MQVRFLPRVLACLRQVTAAIRSKEGIVTAMPSPALPAIAIIKPFAALRQNIASRVRYNRILAVVLPLARFVPAGSYDQPRLASPAGTLRPKHCGGRYNEAGGPWRIVADPGATPWSRGIRAA
jgi:hypothetical protein